MDNLFDGSDAHELCAACSGTGRVLAGEICKFCGDKRVMRRTKTDTIISALRILSGEIETDDGVVPAALIEAADRMEELKQLLREASGHSSYGQWSESFRLKVTKVI